MKIIVTIVTALILIVIAFATVIVLINEFNCWMKRKKDEQE